MKLSIITVVKNDKTNLLLSLKSVLAQKFIDFEYIIFDGMSTDGTKNFLRNFPQKKIRHIYKKDKNYYDGLNKAIKLAKGDYIGILNAGDIYTSSSILKEVSNKIILTNCDVLFGNLKFLNSKNFISRLWKYPIKKLNMFSALKIASPTLFVKRKFFLKNQYNIKYSISSDTDFNIRIAKKKLKFFYYNKYLIYMKTGGLSTNPHLFFNKMKQDIVILFSHFKIFAPIVYFYKITFKLESLKILGKEKKHK